MHVFFLSTIWLLIRFQFTISSYFLTNGPSSWHDAKTFCENNQTTLAVFTNIDSFVNAKEFMTPKNTTYYWLGLYYECGSYFWLDGTPLAETYQNWVSGEPNGNEWGEACIVGYIGDDGKFVDAPCHQQYYGLCESGEITKREPKIFDCMCQYKVELPEWQLTNPEFQSENWEIEDIDVNAPKNRSRLPINNASVKLMNSTWKSSYMKNKLPFELDHFEIRIQLTANRGDGLLVWLANHEATFETSSPGDIPQFGLYPANFTGLQWRIDPFNNRSWMVTSTKPLNAASFDQVSNSVTQLKIPREKLESESFLLGTSLVYKMQVAGDRITTTCCRNNEKLNSCVSYHSYVQLLEPWSKTLGSSYRPFYFGIGAWAGTETQLVLIKNISIFQCFQEPQTTTTTSTTSSATPTVTKSMTNNNQNEENKLQITKNIKERSSSRILEAVFPSFIEQSSDPFYSVHSLLQECDHFAAYRTAPMQQTSIQFAFGVDSLIGIDTIQQIASVEALLAVSWYVNTCPLTSRDTLTSRPPQLVQVTNSAQVWIPRYRFLTSSSSNSYLAEEGRYGETLGEDLIATIGQEGGSPNRSLSFYWIKAGAFSSSCRLDLRQFPFDLQTCAFSFSLIRAEYLVSINYETSTFLWPNKTERGAEWIYQGRQIVADQMVYGSASVSAIHFMITLKRDPTYYINNLMIPATILVAIELGSFLLPPQSADRPAMSMTVLLAMTFSQMTVLSNVPMTSQRILLLDYVQYLTWLCTGCLFYQMFTCCLAVKSKRSNKPMLLFGIKISKIRFLDLLAFAICLVALGVIIVFFLTK